MEIADQHLKEPLESAFYNKFRKDLPESVNTNHKIVVVASSIDQKSERIISYLSNTYGVNINAVTFQYFQTTEGIELLTRVFLIEPDQVDINTKSNSKRNPSLTLDQFYNIASNNGYDQLPQAIEKIKTLFSKISTNRSKINLFGKSSGKDVLVMSLLPSKCSKSEGLKFELYDQRFMNCFNLNESELKASLPSDIQSWEYDQNENDMKGYQGFFVSVEQLDNFVQKVSALVSKM
ncbi:MAG: hypothetical protein NW214_05260 [Pseudanabaenaceae cyanobacterium bins.39]|nr:hypothetical protein [Pseudanabaenaceae cyanobacterium bins.39]